MTSIGNIVHYRRLKSREFNWFLDGVVPVIGIAVLVYALYKSFFTSFWGAGFGLGQSVVPEEQPELGVTAEVTTPASR